VRVNLKGVASATKRLADGTQVTYYYAWRGGPRLEGEPGTPAFIASYNAAVAARRKPNESVFFALISEYRASAEFRGLSEASVRAYSAYLKLIENEFGDMPIEGLSRPECRGDFKAWRDGMADTPRKADYAWTTLARVLSFAKDRGRITTNPCERGGRIYESDRADKIWSDEQIARLQSFAPEHILPVITLALWTGQRQGDLLRLPWSAYDGLFIRLRQQKTGRRVTIPVADELKQALEGLQKRAPVMLLNSEGLPWTSDGFRASWRTLVERAGLADADRNFHDFRGTAVTRLALAGCTEAEITELVGMSAEMVKRYLKGDAQLAQSAIHKLEQRNRSGSKSANRLQTAANRSNQ
jgi:integrase